MFLRAVCERLLPGVSLRRLRPAEIAALLKAEKAARQHEERQQAALMAMHAETLVYFLGLPHVTDPEGWARVAPSRRALFLNWTGQADEEPPKPKQSGVRAWDITHNGNR